MSTLEKSLLMMLISQLLSLIFSMSALCQVQDNGFEWMSGRPIGEPDRFRLPDGRIDFQELINFYESIPLSKRLGRTVQGIFVPNVDQQEPKTVLPVMPSADLPTQSEDPAQAPPAKENDKLSVPPMEKVAVENEKVSGMNNQEMKTNAPSSTEQTTAHNLPAKDVSTKSSTTTDSSSPTTTGSRPSTAQNSSSVDTLYSFYGLLIAMFFSFLLL